MATASASAPRLPWPRRLRLRAIRAAWNTLALALLAVYGFPLYWMLTTSAKSGRDATRVPPTWVPRAATLDSYQRLLASHAWWGLLGRSALVSVTAVAVSTLVGALAAYALVRFRFYGRTAFTALVLGVQAIPQVALVIPVYIQLARVHLLDRLFPLSLVYVTFSLPLTIWIVSTFVRNVPPEVEEAGMVDGLSRFGVFRRIVVPLAAPGFVAAAMYSFILGWNEYLYGYTLLTDRHWTLALQMGALVDIPGVFGPYQMAFGTLMMIPPLLLFLVGYRWIATGLIGGAVQVRRPLVVRAGARRSVDRRAVRRLGVRVAVAAAVVVAVGAGWHAAYGGSSSVVAPRLAPVAAPRAALSVEPLARADVVVFAPHPDDEVIATAGVIQQARARGERVAVVYMTSGDGYGLAIGAREGKTLDTLTARDYLRLNAIRQREALKALARLGLPRGAALFLGFPDGALDQVAADRGGTPVRSPYTTQRATFGAAVRDVSATLTGIPEPYTRAGAVAAVERVLRRLRPRAIYTTMAADEHPDHAATYDLVSTAAREVRFRGPLLTFIVHGNARWPWPRGANYGARFVLRKDALPKGVAWPAPLHVTLTPGQFRVKAAALDEERSQMGLGFERAYLVGFLKREELFWPVRVTRS
jgi:N,N'-diacetylchitobiose transport system permease protein